MAGRVAGTDVLACRGWWCEFIAQRGGEAGEVTHTRTRVATSAEQAMLWMRMSVRELVSVFPPPDIERVYQWLTYGQWEAVTRLKTGEMHTFTVCVGGCCLEWSARSVLLLHCRNGNCRQGARR